jgi:hypothetical protein
MGNVLLFRRPDKGSQEGITRSGRRGAKACDKTPLEFARLELEKALTLARHYFAKAFLTSLLGAVAGSALCLLLIEAGTAERIEAEIQSQHAVAAISFGSLVLIIALSSWLMSLSARIKWRKAEKRLRSLCMEYAVGWPELFEERPELLNHIPRQGATQ